MQKKQKMKTIFVVDRQKRIFRGTVPDSRWRRQKLLLVRVGDEDLFVYRRGFMGFITFAGFASEKLANKFIDDLKEKLHKTRRQFLLLSMLRAQKACTVGIRH